MKEKNRLSYVEVIIIAVVLSVIGMRVFPQFVEAGPESQIGDLIDGLHKMRSQLDLYRAHHAGSLPDVDSFACFEAAMTKKTGRYGPYVRNIPTNPFNELNTVRFDGEPAGAGTAGWRLDTDTGVFQADDSVPHAGL